MVVQHQILHDFLQGNGNLKHWISAINSAASSKIGWIPMEVCIYSRTTFKRKPLRPHWHISKQIPRLSVKINRIQLFCKKKAKLKLNTFRLTDTNKQITCNANSASSELFYSAIVRLITYSWRRVYSQSRKIDCSVEFCKIQRENPLVPASKRNACLIRVMMISFE